jgi:hypothetical protein
VTVVIPYPAPSATTHCTDGLAGFPAIDFGGSVGEAVAISEYGVAFNVHLIPWGGKVGGFTVYFQSPSGTYFITHLEDAVTGGTYPAGAVLGHLADPVAHGGDWTFVHTHVGATFWPDPPGKHCGISLVAHPNVGTINIPGGAVRPFGADPTNTEQVALAHASHLPGAWRHFTRSLSRTLPTQMRRARVAHRNLRRVVESKTQQRP